MDRDGLVYEPSFEDLLETNCLAQSKMTIEELCTTKPSFYLERTDGQYKLKQKHNYYYQVQGQMYRISGFIGESNIWRFV